MFKNYLKITLRNIQKHKGYSFINIAGLSIGMTCFIVIMLYIQYEFSYDRFHENADYIYRIVMKQPGNVYQGIDVFNVTPGTLVPLLKAEYPEVEKAARISKGSGLIQANGKSFVERSCLYVDPDFLQMFTFPMISGNSTTALTEPYSMVITQEMANKYFGDRSPIGETITHDNKTKYKVTGVVENIPENSHFTFDFLASFSTFYSERGKDRIERWNSNSYKAYIQLRRDTDAANLQSQFPALVTKYKGEDSEHQFLLQPLTQIHLDGNINFELGTNNDMRYIYIFSAIGLFILLIACFNYMNLATARSVQRAKEVGLRKVVGADRIQLIRQFMGESVLFAVTALLLALIFVKLLLPVFSSFIDRNLEFYLLRDISLPLELLAISLIVAVVSGIYPAFFISSYQPAAILKGSLNKGSKASSVFRNSLVVFQFVISIILIFSTVTIYQQLNYIRNKNLGFQKDHIVSVYIRDLNLRKKHETFKISQNPGYCCLSRASRYD